MLYCSVGERIMIMRKRNNLSRKELAEMINVTPATIANYERGVTKPSMEKLSAIAFALNVYADDLISINDRENSGQLQQELRLDDCSEGMTDYHKLLDECEKIRKHTNITIK